MINVVIIKIYNKNSVHYYTNLQDDVLENGIIYKASLCRLNSINFNNIKNINESITIDFHFSIVKDFNTIDNLLKSRLDIYFLNTTNINDKKLLYKGFVESINEKNNLTLALNVVSILQKLKSVQGNFFSKTCRASLGDSKCGINLENLCYIGKVKGSLSLNNFIGQHTIPEVDYFRFGKILFTSGKNIGKEYQIQSDKNGTIRLLLNCEYEITIGDEYKIYPGCNKYLATCIKKFNNAKNFRGEPFIGN